VNHDVIKAQFDSFVIRAKNELKIEIDKRAIRIFSSYLNCFSFNGDVAKREKDLVGHKGSIPFKRYLTKKGNSINSTSDLNMMRTTGSLILIRAVMTFTNSRMQDISTTCMVHLLGSNMVKTKFRLWTMPTFCKAG
jgi:hypothetical protein